MISDELEKAAIRLQTEKKRLSHTIDGIEDSGMKHELRDSTGELSAYDNHPADLASEVFERSKDLALRDNETILLSNIENALRKIEDNTYGICEICGDKIPEERLDAVPWAVNCVTCQKELESHEIATRPIEEYSLQYPFGRSFLDRDPKEPLGFDGEDSLQAVWRYGSSDSPQDLPGSHDYNDLNIDPDEQEGIVDPVDIIPAHADGSQDKAAQIHHGQIRKRMEERW